MKKKKKTVFQLKYGCCGCLRVLKETSFPFFNLFFVRAASNLFRIGNKVGSSKKMAFIRQQYQKERVFKKMNDNGLGWGGDWGNSGNCTNKTGVPFAVGSRLHDSGLERQRCSC